jgi:hypothetical protein
MREASLRQILPFRRFEVRRTTRMPKRRTNSVSAARAFCSSLPRRVWFILLSADRWADDVPVPTFGPRMVCTKCGIIGADARPNWLEQPPRETLTGVPMAMIPSAPASAPCFKLLARSRNEKAPLGGTGPAGPRGGAADAMPGEAAFAGLF